MRTSTQGRGGREPQALASAGLILMDSSQRPVYYNPEAIRILTYPESIKKVKKVADFPTEIQSWLLRQRSSNGAAPAAEYTSGRRRYVCRAFTLVHNSGKPARAITGLLIERSVRKVVNVSEVAARFGLTQREQETVGLLTLGLTSKEIATRMNISPNTVKAFFRLVMTKMAVSTRSGIVGKIAGM
jgi:DNA-binding CsgD family transcriptional regulator